MYYRNTSRRRRTALSCAVYLIKLIYINFTEMFSWLLQELLWPAHHHHFASTGVKKCLPSADGLRDPSVAQTQPWHRSVVWCVQRYTRHTELIQQPMTKTNDTLASPSTSSGPATNPQHDSGLRDGFSLAAGDPTLAVDDAPRFLSLL